MTNSGFATARVHIYECRAFSEHVERAIATVRDANGIEVQLSVPFTATRMGQTAPAKYVERWRAVIDALSKKKAYPFGERGWEVAIDGGEALIGNEISASYSGIADHERIDLVAFQKVLEEVCSDASRIWVHGLYRAEMPRN